MVKVSNNYYFIHIQLSLSRKLHLCDTQACMFWNLFCISTLRFYYRMWRVSLLWKHHPPFIGLLFVNIEPTLLLVIHYYGKNSFISY